MDIVFSDASVLFKSAVTRFLLGAAQTGDYRAVWSQAVVDEARRSLLEKNRLGALAALEQNINLIRDPLVPQASVELEAMLARIHTKDRHVLAAASGATILVTDNPKDFDVDEARRLGITVLTSDEFATSIALRNPHALIRAVQRVPADRFERYMHILSDELPEAMHVIAPMLLD
jgi:hypothetical protein